MIKPGKYVAREETRIQVKSMQLDLDFIKKIVEKIKSTGDTSELDYPVLVYFPEEFKDPSTGEIIPENSHMLVGCNHGVQIAIESGIFRRDAYVINFKLHLDSKMSNVRGIGNELNDTYREDQGLADEDIQTEFYTLMDEREAAGLPAHPTLEQQQEFVKRYNQLNSAKVANWIAHHVTGGRSKSGKSWSTDELAQQKLSYENDLTYTDYLVLSPTTTASWDGEVLGRMINQCWKKSKSEDRIVRKVLIILYAKNLSQQNQIKDEAGKVYQEELRQNYKDIAESMNSGIENEELHWKIDVVFLRYE